MTAGGNTWPQAVQTLQLTPYTYTTAASTNTAVHKLVGLLPGAATHSAHLVALDCSITPRSVGSKIHVEFDFHSETNELHGWPFVLVRYDTVTNTRTLLGVPSSGVGNRLCGTAIENSYPDVDTASTMQAHSIRFLDTPATTNTITYELHWTGTSAQDIHINRTWTDTNSSGYERTSSRTILTEYFA
jgi:hypothetical protein